MLKAHTSGSLDDIRPIEENLDITEKFLASCSATIVHFQNGIDPAKCQGQHGWSLLSRRYSSICTYIDGSPMITNVISPQPEILRSILRVMSQVSMRPKQSSCVVLLSLFEVFRVISGLRQSIVVKKVDLVRWRRPSQPIALCFRSPCHFQSIAIKLQAASQRPTRGIMKRSANMRQGLHVT